jgi:fructose-1,6-bisphosphatase II
MKKLAYPLAVRRAWMADQSLPIHIDAPVEDVIDVTARILGTQVRDVVICVMDRARNQNIIEAVRQKGATLR